VAICLILIDDHASPFLFLFFETRSGYVPESDLELIILLPMPLQCWDYRCGPPCLGLSFKFGPGIIHRIWWKWCAHFWPWPEKCLVASIYILLATLYCHLKSPATVLKGPGAHKWGKITQTTWGEPEVYHPLVLTWAQSLAKLPAKCNLPSDHQQKYH
jgi:hypothetical protein